MNAKVIRTVAGCDAEALQALLDAGANAQAQDEKGWSALRRAALNGCCPIALLLLEHGASVDFGGSAGNTSPLLVAAANNRSRMVKLLLAHGADINRCSEEAVLCPTALAAAAFRGHAGIVRLLLESGADIEKRGYRGQTVIFSWNPNVVRLLIEQGADVTVKNNDGETALMSALHELHHEEFYEGMQETVELLQEASGRRFA